MSALCKCELCGVPNEEREERQNTYRYGYSSRSLVTVQTVSVRRCRGMFLCESCAGGLESGEYAAVGVVHELKGCQAGRAFGIADGISYKGPGPVIQQTRAMTLDAILKAHQKGNAKTAERKAWESEAA